MKAVINLTLITAFLLVNLQRPSHWTYNVNNAVLGAIKNRRLKWLSKSRRPLKAFLCHASGDKPSVWELYKRLTTEGVDVWLDKEKLLPGQDWRLEIPNAVREADDDHFADTDGITEKAPKSYQNQQPFQPKTLVLIHLLPIFLPVRVFYQPQRLVLLKRVFYRL